MSYETKPIQTDTEAFRQFWAQAGEDVQFVQIQRWDDRDIIPLGFVALAPGPQVLEALDASKAVRFAGVECWPKSLWREKGRVLLTEEGYPLTNEPVTEDFAVIRTGYNGYTELLVDYVSGTCRFDRVISFDLICQVSPASRGDFEDHRRQVLEALDDSVTGGGSIQ